MKRGLFISFEGGDGSGKSTQIRKLCDYLSENGYDYVLSREPGGTSIGEQIRKIILDPDNTEMDYLTEAYLYAASRAQHVSQVIRPALESGKTVICDRFLDSSIAYQGYARGLGSCVEEINSYAVGDCLPDITFLLKVSPETGKERRSSREEDRIEHEELDFHRRVFNGYERIEENSHGRVIGIDASMDIDTIFDIIRTVIEDRL